MRVPLYLFTLKLLAKKSFFSALLLVSLALPVFIQGQKQPLVVSQNHTDETEQRPKMLNNEPIRLNPLNLVPIPAFPGAQGYGAQATGGRGGRVIEVTNLNDSGPGSLRVAVEAEGPRIVVFRVAGIIQLDKEIRIRNPYLTIAGQTAPGGGITAKGSNDVLLQTSHGVHDIVIRYLRLRNGAGDPGDYDNFTIRGGHDIILDHVSMSWSTDENFGIWKDSDNSPIYNITLQRSLIAEGLTDHSNGLLIGGEMDYSNPHNPLEEWRQVDKLSIHHNLFAHNSHRNPRVTSSGAQVINNVVYNWQFRVGSTTSGSVIDYIGNYYKNGPMSDPNRILLHENFDPGQPLILFPDPSIYISGNVALPNHPDPQADNWPLLTYNYLDTFLPTTFRRSTPLPRAPVSVNIQSAADAYQTVLTNAGANARLDCFGNWVSNRDSVDMRIVADVINNTGPSKPIDSPDEVGGYPKIDPGTPCTDTDHDGMPDAWEIKYNFDLRNPNDGPIDRDGDGYTNIEEYLNGTNPL